MGNKLQVVYRPIGEVKPYDKNPRKNDDAVKFVKNSIEKFGFRNPIIIDTDGVIVAGHTRYKAAQELGLEEVPTISADDLTPEQIKAFRIADNKTAERADWDNELLKEELSDLLDDFEMTDFGFGDFELTILTGDFDPEPYDEEMAGQYSQNEDNFLDRKRIIISFTSDTEGLVADMLGVEEINKVTYDILELRAGAGE